MSTFWSSANNGSQLIDFDTASGLASVIASNSGNSAPGWGGLAFAPDGTAYTLMGATQTLARVDLGTGAMTQIGTGSSTNFGYALDFAPNGTLYAISGVNGNVYTVNTTSGVFTLVGSVTGETSIQDITFDAAGNLYAVGSGTQSNQNIVYAINTGTWAATARFTTALGNLSGIAADANGNLVATSTANPSQYETINVGDGTSVIVGTVGTTKFDHGGDIFLIGAPTGLQLDAATDSRTTGDNITSSTAPAIDGLALAGSSVTLLDGSTVVGHGTADSTGHFRITSSTLTEGTHQLTATATLDGSTSAASGQLSITIDKTAPAAPGGLADSAIASGYVNAAGDTASQAVTGTAEAGATITVSDGTTALGTTTADSKGNWSYKLGVLGDGSHSVTAIATDAAGNASAASNALTFTVDATAPSAPTLALKTDSGASSTDGITNNATLVLGRTETGATIEYSADGKAWGASFTAVEGANTVYVRQTDVAGNVSAASSALTFTLDTKADAPTLALKTDSGASQTDGITNDGTLAIGGTESGATIEYSTDGKAWGASFTAVEGANTVYVRQTDVAGNVSGASSALTFTLDTKAPAAPTGLADTSVVSGYVNAAHNTASQTLTGLAEAGSTVVISDGTQQLNAGSPVTADSSGHWSYVLGSLAEGLHSFTAAATDLAGNAGPASSAFAFTVDTALPLTAITDVVQTVTRTASTTLVSGTTEANSTVTVFDTSGSALGTSKADAGGHWALSLTNLSNVVHMLTASAVDSAGNAGPTSNTAFFGTSGNDALVAAGNGDLVLGNGGNNAMLAAAGVDTFVFHPNFGKNAIGAFGATQDVLAFDHALLPTTISTDAALAAWLLARTTDVAGSATIVIDAQDTVTLTGVPKVALTAANFHLL